MKEFIKKFGTAVSADNYSIGDIPFITTAADTKQNLCCAVSGKKIKVVSGVMSLDSAGPEMIDLGLSVKWAAWNVGANSIGEYGAYFAWGETDEKSNYEWGTYEHANGDYNKLTKYCPTDKTDYWDGEGSPDNKLVLDAADDVATQAYGSDYRMPTIAEIEELIALPNKWTTVNGVKGRVFVSESQSGVSEGDFSIVDDPGLYFYDADQDFEMAVSDYLSADALKYITSIDELNAILTDTFAYQEGYEGQADVTTMLFKDEEHTILAVAGTDYTFGTFPAFNASTMLFIPAAGRFDGSSVYDTGDSGYVWSSSLYSGDPGSARRLNFNSGTVGASYDNRCHGNSVRAVQHVSNS